MERKELISHDLIQNEKMKMKYAPQKLRRKSQWQLPRSNWRTHEAENFEMLHQFRYSIGFMDENWKFLGPKICKKNLDCPGIDNSLNLEKKIEKDKFLSRSRKINIFSFSFYTRF